MSDKPKFRCHVYGCTIPAGIFHEHDRVAENYAAVMRDPVAPLTADERAELESFRREALLREYANEQLARNKRREALYAQATAMQNAYPSSGAQQNSRFNTDEQRLRNYRNNALFEVAALTPPSITIPTGDVYVVPADAKIHGGRKLRDALLMAGHNTYEQNRENAAITCNELAMKALDELKASRPRREGHVNPDADIRDDRYAYIPRSFVSTAARVAFWIVLAVTVAIWIFAGVKS